MGIKATLDTANTLFPTVHRRLHFPIPSATCDIAGSMTPAEQAALVSLLIEVMNGAKAVRYFNVASVSQLLTALRY